MSYKKEEAIGQVVVNIAYQLHKTLGPGLLESVYERCFHHELEKKGLVFLTQQRVPIVYDGITFDESLRLDLIIEDLVIVEFKAQENYHPVWEAQLLSYLRLTRKDLGFLINFTVPLIKDGIKRMVARPL